MATSNWDTKTGLKFEGETEVLETCPRGDFLFFLSIFIISGFWREFQFWEVSSFRQSERGHKESLPIRGGSTL